MRWSRAWCGRRGGCDQTRSTPELSVLWADPKTEWSASAAGENPAARGLEDQEGAPEAGAEGFVMRPSGSMTELVDLVAFRRRVAQLGAELVQLGLLDGPDEPGDVLKPPGASGARPEPLAGQLRRDGAKGRAALLQFPKKP